MELTTAPRAHREAGQRYWGRGALIGGIRAYRRFLSGRGPLRRVHCSFHHCESCSAYGLRVAQECGHLFRALALIWGRLERCSQASFFAHDAHLVWGELYDLRPHELDVLLDRTDELAPTRAMLWSGAGLAAKLRCDSDAERDCADQARRAIASAVSREGSPRASEAASPKLVLRDTHVQLQRLRRRGRVRTLQVALLLGLMAVVPTQVWALLVALALQRASSARTCVKRRRRLERLRWASEFSVMR